MPSLHGQFEMLGGLVRAEGEYDVPYAFCDLPSFLFWLRALPMPEDLDADKHAEQIAMIIHDCVSDRGLVSNEHRHLLVVQKS